MVEISRQAEQLLACQDGLCSMQCGSSEQTHLRSATCAAMTRWRSTTSWQLGHWHSRHRHSRLCPLRHEITPWLRHRAHLGVRSNLRPAPVPPRLPRTSRSDAGGVFIPWKRKTGTSHYSSLDIFVKLYLRLIKHHAIKNSGGTAPCIRTLMNRTSLWSC